MLPWGIGLGLLTPAVVAAAIGAVEPERAGLLTAGLFLAATLTTLALIPAGPRP